MVKLIMMQKLTDRGIPILYYLLFLLVPLALYPKTSEIFEFNKIVVVYFITALVIGIWLIKMILLGKVIFRRTFLDIPLIVFLTAMGISWIFSIDPHTSFYGYYSRFNGGLLSLITYSFLYWAYVSNIEKPETKKVIFVIFGSTLIASLWAIFEHFGHSFSCLIFPDFRVFDNSCWVQDVQNRSFSTFGQPNWLAAWLTAVIPLSWTFGLKNKKDKQFSRYFMYAGFFVLSLVFFATLLYTKSRSGLLGFGVSFTIFWGYYFLLHFKNIGKKILHLLAHSLAISIIVLLVGTPWSQTLKQYIFKTPIVPQNPVTSSPALESGGTESGTIRKIVWKGAIDIWRAYPVFGTGLETFAFSYYAFKPIEHNLTSEWDFLYNKAHNEYLNFMATTGTMGTLTYLWLIVTTLIVFVKTIKTLYKPKDEKNDNRTLLPTALLAGYVSILITNFFGFSTVSSNILFFIFPALSVSLINPNTKNKKPIADINNLNFQQKFTTILVILAVIYVLNRIVGYWLADRTYANAKNLNDSGKYIEAYVSLKELTLKNPTEPTYLDELSNSYSNLAIYYSESGQNQLAKKFADDSYREMKKAIDLSPASVTIKRKAATRLISMANVDMDYLLLSKNVLESAIVLAPTDAKLRYNLGLTYLRTGDYENAIKHVKETIILKPDYELAHYALALIYIDNGQKDQARAEFEYILREINPNNVNVQRELNELRE